MSDNKKETTQTLQWFKAALKDRIKRSGQTQKDFIAGLEVPSQTVKNFLGKGPFSLAKMEIVAKNLGSDVSSMLASGRAILEGENPQGETAPAITSERELELLRKNEALTDEIVSINKQLADKDDCLKNKDCQLEARAAFIQKLGDANVQLVEILRTAGLENVIPPELLFFVMTNRPEESETKR